MTKHSLIDRLAEDHFCEGYYCLHNDTMHEAAAELMRLRQELQKRLELLRDEETKNAKLRATLQDVQQWCNPVGAELIRMALEATDTSIT